jgi:pyruvate/2-oxoglutarate dehydrogenase complex dihydrolipoamide acyltransferase (E2) component
MNSNKQVSLKKTHYDWLRDTAPGPFTEIVLGVLDDAFSEAAFRVALPGDVDRVRLYKAKTETTARFSMTRLVRSVPALKVPVGFNRLFPVSIQTIDGLPYMVLDLKNTTVELIETTLSAEEAAQKEAEKAAEKAAKAAQRAAEKAAKAAQKAAERAARKAARDAGGNAAVSSAGSAGPEA